MANGEITIYGASDDRVEIEGVLLEEFDCYETTVLVALSDGTLLRVRYDDDGMWRISTLRRGSATVVSFVEAVDCDGDYTDRLTLCGEFGWAVFADEDKAMKVFAKRGEGGDE